MVFSKLKESKGSQGLSLILHLHELAGWVKVSRAESSPKTSQRVREDGDKASHACLKFGASLSCLRKLLTDVSAFLSG